MSKANDWRWNERSDDDFRSLQGFGNLMARFGEDITMFLNRILFMHNPSPSMRRFRWLVCALGGLVVSAAAASAQDNGVRCLEVKGALLAAGGDYRNWTPIRAGDRVPDGTILVSMFEARFETANKAVGFKMLGDIGEFGPLPVLESAIRVEESGQADCAVTLFRGIVGFANLKEQGAAHVTLKMHGEEMKITLQTPGTKVGVELYGRHPGGVRHILKDEPTIFVYALVREGAATLSAKDHTIELKAAPGNAMLRWDSISRKGEVVHLDKFPAEFERDEQAKAQFAKICTAAEQLAGKNPVEGAAQLAAADSALERRTGVTALGALNDLGHLLTALEDSKHKDAREQAILAMRAWIGRGPGQVKELRAAMLKHKYSLPQTKMTMHLLFGFDDSERDRPAVAELLVALLESKHLAVRELAHWHLVRLVPKGRDIPYDAGAAEADREAAVARWRQLTSAGEARAPSKDEAK